MQLYIIICAWILLAKVVVVVVVVIVTAVGLDKYK